MAAPDDPRPLGERKAALRTKMRRRRADIAREERDRLAGQARDRLLGLPELSVPRTVMVFASFGSEIPTEAIIAGLAERGHRVLLPIVEDGVLHAVGYRPGDPLVETTYGPQEPADRRAVDPKEVDVVIVPGLAFDRRGGRLGFGGAYYDRYLRLLGAQALKVGIGFRHQLLDEVPVGHDDVALDVVISDREVIRCHPDDQASNR